MPTSNDIRELAKREAMHKEVYSRLANSEKNQALRAHFIMLAKYDSNHSRIWDSMSGEEQKGVSDIKVAFYVLIRRLLGAMFAIKLLERGEHKTILNYRNEIFPRSELGDKSKAHEVIDDELRNETALVEAIKNETGNYVGPVVLGLNDALVELIGVIAGLVSAVSNNLFIGFSGLIVGIASAMSMMASYYLSSDLSEVDRLKSLKGGLYTGASYFLTSLLLVAPFFALGERFVAMSFSLVLAASIICLVSYYGAVVNDRPFGKNLAKMLILGLGVAIIVFLVSRTLSAYLRIAI